MTREEQLEAAVVPLNELHADAAYLAHRVSQGTMTPDDLAEHIRAKIDAALDAPPTPFVAGWEAGRDAAAAECDRLRESYRRSLSLYPEDDPQHRIVKYCGATAAVCAEDIRALTPPAPAPEAKP